MKINQDTHQWSILTCEFNHPLKLQALTLKYTILLLSSWNQDQEVFFVADKDDDWLIFISKGLRRSYIFPCRLIVCLYLYFLPSVWTSCTTMTLNLLTLYWIFVRWKVSLVLWHSRCTLSHETVLCDHPRSEQRTAHQYCPPLWQWLHRGHPGCWISEGTGNHGRVPWGWSGRASHVQVHEVKVLVLHFQKQNILLLPSALITIQVP